MVLEAIQDVAQGCGLGAAVEGAHARVQGRGIAPPGAPVRRLPPPLRVGPLPRRNPLGSWGSGAAPLLRSSHVCRADSNRVLLNTFL